MALLAPSRRGDPVTPLSELVDQHTPLDVRRALPSLIDVESCKYLRRGVLVLLEPNSNPVKVRHVCRRWRQP